MIPKKVTWARFPDRVTAVYSKLLLINDLLVSVFINIYESTQKFSDRISDQEICSAMLYKLCNFSPIFFIFF